MAILNRIASDGEPVEMTDCTMDKDKMKLSVIAPTHKHCPERADKTITVIPCWEVSYNDKGYFASAKNISEEAIPPMYNFAFVNEAVGDEKVPIIGTYYKNATASSDDGVVFTVYDGATNEVCIANTITKEVTPNIGDSNDKELAARMNSYGKAFLMAYCNCIYFELKGKG